MAKRANPGAAPSYAPLPSVDARARNESGFQKFMREQVWAADKIGGNISILIGVSFFTASIIATRQWGSLLLVPSN
ncbi:SubName: Full=Uncharacterized protein {ECO:0000313/EMBL:CCA77846.1} [Serendipita indica DSM 11827]|nr:SubName: Full=Uncharacterized protein {ECO:0000313/EMBL:CCA77846.1} [Serendipita indica DSM 11827]